MAIKLTNTDVRNLTLLNEGGEAYIYGYSNNTVLKIYKKNVDVLMKRKKVERLLKAKLPSNIIAPIDIVEINDRFAGYMMKKVDNAEVIHQYTKTNHKKIAKLSNKDMIGLSIKIGETLEILHNIGVVIGDISDYNILVSNKNKSELTPLFIDTDSWGIGNTLLPDAYTELFISPESYNNGRILLNKKSDLYSYAILVFNIINNIHPFNGTLKKHNNDKIDMSTIERMKNKISILGKHKSFDIIIPKIVKSWKWMSPELYKSFLDVFENEKRFNIKDVLKNEYNNMKYCSVHKTYYFNKYTECPICNNEAKVVISPTFVKTTANNNIVVKVLFQDNDVNVIINEQMYISNQDEIVHIGTKRKIKQKYGNRIFFSNDGKYVFKITKEDIQILGQEDNLVSTIERKYNTVYKIFDNNLYYIDKSDILNRVTITKNGNIKESIAQTYNTIYEVSKQGKLFIISLYPKKAIINIDNHNFEVPYNGKIREYAIKYDYVSDKWLFIYKLLNGKFRSLVFSDKEIIFDQDNIAYNAETLSNIEFVNNTIYDPSAGKIIGINYLKNVCKEFICDIVQEDSKLEFRDNKFIIINNEKIYSFGN